ncbi:response regulator transcription factor [Variovorax sp. KK3]|uniref:response regulator transcription factor n=1 Tax=Variovorax sp. KK3 TaxID=1855728 RepID=UPI0009F8E429|nr:response regulator transcription factor [Variovorax sp. KK3]
MNVLLVEDQPVVSEATADKVSRNPRVASIHVCNTAQQALQALSSQPAHWGLILLDLDVPGAVGLSLATEIARAGKAPITCILTGSPRPDYIAQIRAAGFLGYILKAMEVEPLVRALDTVLAGEKSFPAACSTTAGVPRLTARQTECLQLVSEGKSTKQIAQILKLHMGTVNYHIDSAMDALDVNSRAHAVQRALRFGLVTLRGVLA